jgi:hypothetical protein
MMLPSGTVAVKNAKTNNTVRNVQIKAPEDALDLLQEDIEDETSTSIILGKYFPKNLKSQVEARWKQLVTGQAFTGSYLEQYGMQWVNPDKVGDVIDCARRVQTGWKNGQFLHMFVGGQNKTIGRMYLKAKYSMSEVNTDPNWKVLATKAKGQFDAEPDIIMWLPKRVSANGRTIPPTICLIEMKVGKGKKDSGEEWNQLCRVKWTLKKWLNEFQASNSPELRKALNNGWMRPNIEMYFCGWSADSAGSVEFSAPRYPYMGLKKGTLMPYRPDDAEWFVNPINRDGFGMLTGVRASFITKIIAELNHDRLKALFQVLEEFMTPRGTYYREYKSAFNNNMVRLNQELGESVYRELRPAEGGSFLTGAYGNGNVNKNVVETQGLGKRAAVKGAAKRAVKSVAKTGIHAVSAGLLAAKYLGQRALGVAGRPAEQQILNRIQANRNKIRSGQTTLISLYDNLKSKFGINNILKGLNLANRSPNNVVRNIAAGVRNAANSNRLYQREASAQSNNLPY